MLNLTYSTTINADPQTVYNILTDLPSYADWNPWNFAARGEAVVGGPLVEVDVRLGSRVMTVKHRILVTAEPRVFQWCDTGWFTSLVYGQRTRYIDPCPEGGVEYRVEILLAGVLAPVAQAFFGKHMDEGMAAETEALKKRAEAIDTEK